MSMKMPSGLGFGGRHNTVFRDSLVQRSIVIKGTASIQRVKSTNVQTETLQLGSGVGGTYLLRVADGQLQVLKNGDVISTFS